ncbi:MAG: hypothetical protein M1814_005578 [Vezdaea aestivalis]|nr:MAG: hypothetical protein M1814_005578 [Vezdaea aestivalis]
MPGVLPIKMIQVAGVSRSRSAQACDRCRSKKIKCNGALPVCSQCASIDFNCRTTDNLSRRAFPRGYTQELETRIRALEAEVKELKLLLDDRDNKLDMLSRIKSDSSRCNGRLSQVAEPSSTADNQQSVDATLQSPPLAPHVPQSQPPQTQPPDPLPNIDSRNFSIPSQPNLDYLSFTSAPLTPASMFASTSSPDANKPSPPISAGAVAGDLDSILGSGGVDGLDPAEVENILYGGINWSALGEEDSRQVGLSNGNRESGGVANREHQAGFDDAFGL